MKKIYKFVKEYGFITKSEAKQFYKDAKQKNKELKRNKIKNHLTELFDYNGPIINRKPYETK